MTESLELAGALRGSEPDRAFSLYRRLAEQLDPADGATLTWIAERCRPVVPEDLRPLFERVAQAPAAWPHRRLALHKLGATAWYEGRTEQAEDCWLRAAQDGRASRDLTWCRALNNLGLVRSSRGRYFEGLVLHGLASRAPSAGTMEIGFGKLHRVRCLLGMGDLARARVELVDAQRFCERHPEASGIDVVAATLLMAEQMLLMAELDWEGALAAAWRHAEWASRSPLPEAVEVGRRVRHLRIRFELEPEGRESILAELEELRAEYTAPGRSWRASLEGETQLLRWRCALHRGDVHAAAEAARGLLAIEPWDMEDGLLREALALLEREPLPAPLTEALLQRGANDCLRRILESRQDTQGLPELAELTPEDRAVLREYQARLSRQRGPLLERLAEVLGGGDGPLHPHLPSGSREPLRICAWCLQVQGRDGTWSLIVELPVLARELNHGICERCAELQLAGV